MKIQFILNKVKNIALAKQGIEHYVQELRSIGYTVDYSYKNIDKTFNTYIFSSDVVNNVNSVYANELIPFMEQGNRLSIFILGETSSTPRQSNPIQYPVNLMGNTAIAVPEHWYGADFTTLSLYLLHETDHAGFFFAGKPDTVHTVPAKYGSIVDGNRVYYKDLLKELKPVLELKQSVPTITQILKLGSRGENVKELQQLLREKGYFNYPSNTGYFGLFTKNAVTAYQKSQGLVADGIAGKVTIESLKKKPSIDLSNWDLTDDCEKVCLQFLLNCKAAGYDIKITQGRRTQAYQDALYNQPWDGKDNDGDGLIDESDEKVTWTKKSKHIEGKAFDIAFTGKTPYPKNFDWSKIGVIGESLGLRWGGRFSNPDNLHFEI